MVRGDLSWVLDSVLCVICFGVWLGPAVWLGFCLLCDVDGPELHSDGSEAQGRVSMLCTERWAALYTEWLRDDGSWKPNNIDRRGFTHKRNRVTSPRKVSRMIRSTLRVI